MKRSPGSLSDSLERTSFMKLMLSNPQMSIYESSPPKKVNEDEEDGQDDALAEFKKLRDEFTHFSEELNSSIISSNPTYDESKIPSSSSNTGQDVMLFQMEEDDSPRLFQMEEDNLQYRLQQQQKGKQKEKEREKPLLARSPPSQNITSPLSNSKRSPPSTALTKAVPELPMPSNPFPPIKQQQQQQPKPLSASPISFQKTPINNDPISFQKSPINTNTNTRMTVSPFKPLQQIDMPNNEKTTTNHPIVSKGFLYNENESFDSGGSSGDEEIFPRTGIATNNSRKRDSNQRPLSPILGFDNSF